MTAAGAGSEVATGPATTRRRPFADATPAVLAAVATTFTILGWSGLAVDPSGYTRPLTILAFGVAVVGVVLRSMGLPRPAVVLLQAVGVAEVLHVRWAGDVATGGWVPSASSLAEVGATLQRAAAAAQEWAAPVPEEATAFDPLMIAVGAVVILLVDAYATTYARATLAGLPLLAAFTLPVAVTGGMRWDYFVLAAGAFLLLVAAEQLRWVGVWGHSLTGFSGQESAGGEPTPLPTVTLLGRSRGPLVRVLAPSLLVAVAASALVPDSVGLIGRGGGGDSGDVTIDNPLTDLRRDLVQGPDVNLLTVRTDDPDPSYLRISALDSFDGNTWRPSQRDLPPSQRVEGSLPPPAGLSDDVPQRSHLYRVSAWEDFESDWLPLPFPAVAASAPGDWRYDTDTLDVTTLDDDLDTAGLDYTATGLRALPTADQLVAATSPPARIARANTELPFENDVPEWLSQLTDDVTAGGDSSFARAVALQQWFRDPANFRYSTERGAGNGVDDLRSFLTPGPDGRVGYCEQFASAMAVMARLQGIPARVAVGFLRGDDVGPDTWLFSAHDLHAWPELYFGGVGWVRFEPTPADQAPSVPGYTVGQVPEVAPTERPSASASAPSDDRTLRQEDPIESAGAGGDTGGASWWWALPGLVLLLPLLLLTPRIVRFRQRRLRARAVAVDGDHGAEAAWDELRAVVIDLGHDWDDHVTLDRQRHRLLTLVRQAPIGSRRAGAGSPTPVDQVEAAVEAVVASVERARFAAQPLPQEQGESAWASTTLVTRALWHRADPRQRRRATWWPSSVPRGSTEPVEGSEAAQQRSRASQEDNLRV